MCRVFSITALVLAAGSSRRMGAVNKLLIEIDGMPIIERVVNAIQRGGVDDLLVVTGFESEKIEDCLKATGSRFVFNEEYKEGMGTSISNGVSSLPEQGIDGFMICLGDLPYLRTDTIEQVLGAFRSAGGEKIIVPRCGGRRGHPIAFPVAYRAELELLRGDAGARRLLEREESSILYLEVDSPSIIQDVDTPGEV